MCGFELVRFRFGASREPQHVYLHCNDFEHWAAVVRQTSHRSVSASALHWSILLTDQKLSQDWLRPSHQPSLVILSPRHIRKAWLTAPHTWATFSDIGTGSSVSGP